MCGESIPSIPNSKHTFYAFAQKLSELDLNSDGPKSGCKSAKRVCSCSGHCTLKCLVTFRITSNLCPNPGHSKSRRCEESVRVSKRQEAADSFTFTARFLSSTCSYDERPWWWSSTLNLQLLQASCLPPARHLHLEFCLKVSKCEKRAGGWLPFALNLHCTLPFFQLLIILI